MLAPKLLETERSLLGCSVAGVAMKYAGATKQNQGFVVQEAKWFGFFVCLFVFLIYLSSWREGKKTPQLPNI